MAELRRTPAVLVSGAAIACGWWATGLEPFSTPATAAVLVSGSVAMALGATRRRALAEQSVALRAGVPLLVLVGALVAWQLAAYLQHPRADHPTLSSLTNAALDPRPMRALAFAAWLLAAGWLARR